MTLIVGTNANDVLNGTSKNDLLIGLDGDDHLYGKGGNDLLDGGRGDDRVYGNGGNDLLNGGRGNDYLDGGIGNDILIVRAGSDELHGGAGNDWLQAEVKGSAAAVPGEFVAATMLSGDEGHDHLLSTTTFKPSTLDPNYVSYTATNTLDGGAGNDWMRSASVVDVHAGGVFVFDTLSGGDGNDHLSGVSSLALQGRALQAIILDGGTGADCLNAAAIVDNDASPDSDDAVWTLLGLEGGAGNDRLNLSCLSKSTASAEFSANASGGTGSDWISVTGLLDAASRINASVRVFGDDRPGDSVPPAEGGNDVITIDLTLQADSASIEVLADGGKGDDYILSSLKAPDGGGPMELQGGAGNDRLIAEGGNENLLHGGAGSDRMTGSSDLDYFTFTFGDVLGNPAEMADGQRDRDVITNYSKAEGDQIDLPNGIADVFAWDVTGSSTRLTLVGDHDVIVLQGLLVTDLANDVIFA
jgi:Ca2+-binding RTX toxin-like protein